MKLKNVFSLLIILIINIIVYMFFLPHKNETCVARIDNYCDNMKIKELVSTIIANDLHDKYECSIWGASHRKKQFRKDVFSIQFPNLGTYYFEGFDEFDKNRLHLSRNVNQMGSLNELFDYFGGKTHTLSYIFNVKKELLDNCIVGIKKNKNITTITTLLSDSTYYDLIKNNLVYKDNYFNPSAEICKKCSKYYYVLMHVNDSNENLIKSLSKKVTVYKIKPNWYYYRRQLCLQ